MHTSTASLRHLSREQLIERVKNAQNQKNEAIRHPSKLHETVQEDIKIEGVNSVKERMKTRVKF